MKVKKGFEQFIINSLKRSKRYGDVSFSNEFREQDTNEKHNILQSLIDMDDVDFFINLNDTIKILPAFSSEKSVEMKPLLSKVLQKIIRTDPRRIKDMPTRALKIFSKEISESLEDNILAGADVVERIPEENLEDFTEVISAIMQRSDINNLARIVAMIPNAQLSNYLETIKDLMLKSPGVCKTLMPILPHDQVHNFYETLKTVIKDNAYKSPELIAVIPTEKIHEFREIILEVMKKNPDKIIDTIEAVDKRKDLSNYIEGIGRIMRDNPEHAPAIIVSMEKSGKFEEFKSRIWRVMSENPSRAGDIIRAIPENKLSNFYDTIREVIKDDYKFNFIKGQNIPKILAAIPKDKLSNFYSTLYEIIKDDKQLNNGQNVVLIFGAIPKENRVEFVAGSGDLLDNKNLKSILRKVSSTKTFEDESQGSLRRPSFLARQESTKKWERGQ